MLNDGDFSHAYGKYELASNLKKRKKNYRSGEKKCN